MCAPPDVYLPNPSGEEGVVSAPAHALLARGGGGGEVALDTDGEQAPQHVSRQPDQTETPPSNTCIRLCTCIVLWLGKTDDETLVSLSRAQRGQFRPHPSGIRSAPKGGGGKGRVLYAWTCGYLLRP